MTAIERELALTVAESEGRDAEVIAELTAMHETLLFLEALEAKMNDGKPDEHRHQCPNEDCGTVWHHDRSTLLDKGEEHYDKAHACPKCGTKTRKKYYGPKPATCFYDGVELKEDVGSLVASNVV